MSDYILRKAEREARGIPGEILDKEMERLEKKKDEGLVKVIKMAIIKWEQRDWDNNVSCVEGDSLVSYLASHLKKEGWIKKKLTKEQKKQSRAIKKETLLIAEERLRQEK